MASYRAVLPLVLYSFFVSGLTLCTGVRASVRWYEWLKVTMLMRYCMVSSFFCSSIRALMASIISFLCRSMLPLLSITSMRSTVLPSSLSGYRLCVLCSSSFCASSGSVFSGLLVGICSLLWSA